MNEDTLLPFEKIKREVLIKKEAETSTKFGGDPNARSVSELINYGIINIDKPPGPTSHQVSAYAQKILGLKKAGHSGTLDPKVTGVLPIALGRATRIVQTLLIAGKEYVAIMHVHKPIEKEILIKTIKSFVGKIKQLPPIKSAVKRQERYRKIYYIDIIDIQGQDVLMKIGCQAGTYIRKLLHDMGRKMNTGAHMAELRRTKAALFNEENLYTLNDLRDAFYYYNKEGNDKYIRKILQPIENAINHLPKVWVADTSVDSICHGANLKVPGIVKIESDNQIDELIAIMTLKNELVAIGKVKMISKDVIKKNKGLVVEVTKVFMLPGIYPRVAKK